MLEKKLNELNIFALRDLARKTGVNSPTSKKKEILIKEIVEIMSGDKKPDLSKTKQGRPPKVFGYDFANVFGVQNLDGISSVTLRQTEETYGTEDVKTVAGYIELVNNNSAIMWVNKSNGFEHYFVPSEVLKGLDIRTGDYVVAEADVKEKQFFIKSVLNVNDCPILHMSKRKCFADINHCEKNKSIEFGNLKSKQVQINFGQNVYFYGTNNNDNSLTIIDLLSSAKVQNKIYINVSMIDKNKSMLSSINHVEKFVANIMDDTEMVRRLINIAIERAKRIFENGEDVLIVVDDMLSILGVDKDNMSFVKSLASISKVGKVGSVTLVSVMPNENIVQIEKLADQRYKIENNQIVKN